MKNIITLMALSIFLSACEQEDTTPLALNKGEFMNELHKNNVGKIAFMGDWIAFDEFTQNDFGKEVSLANDSDFALRMFLGSTLSSSLSELEPNLSTRELCSKGNFQLTFLVDDQLVYQHNLDPGAGSCEYKNSATVYGIPLANKNNPDHWGRFTWLKFMKKEGGQQALSGTNHKLKIEVRPYIETTELKVGEIMAQGEVNLIMVEKEVSETQVTIQKIAPTEKWEVSNQSFDKELIREMNKKIAQEYFKDITSIVVIKDNKLLLEEYFNEANRSSLHDTRSIGKTMASTVMGIAIKDGLIKDENQKIKNFYDLKAYENYSPQKEEVTIKSLLSMSSGFVGSDSDMDSIGNEEYMYPTSDWVKFGLDLPMDSNKKIGADWDYFTAGAVILGDILNNTVPEGLEKYAEQKLFQPLGIKDYKWEYTTTDVPNTAGGFRMNSLDNARYGQLYLDNGMHNGKQILSQDWVQSSLSHQVAIPNTDNEYYGYLLWNKTYKVNGQSYEAYYASGNGGNKILIFKDLNAVIVLTATAYNQAYAHFQADEIIEKYLLPSIL